MHVPLVGLVWANIEKPISSMTFVQNFEHAQNLNGDHGSHGDVWRSRVSPLDDEGNHFPSSKPPMATWPAWWSHKDSRHKGHRSRIQGRLNRKTSEHRISRPRDGEFSYRSAIWHTHRQHCSRDVCQIVLFHNYPPPPPSCEQPEQRILAHETDGVPTHSSF